MKNYVFLSFCFLLGVSLAYQELTELKQVPPRSYPYLANIESHEWCQGVLITEYYVLTNARCVAGTKGIKIYLGWYSYPEDNNPVNEPDIQIYSASAAILHPDYRQIKEYWLYANDIALVKLSQAVSVTSGVKPGRLANPDTFRNPNLTDQYCQVFGWWPAKYVSAATVQIRSTSDCNHIFGRNFLIDRQLCAKWPEGERLCSHHSLPMEINGALIGLQQDDPRNEIECRLFEFKFINIIFYYDWILENSDLGEYIKTNRQYNRTDNTTENDSEVMKTVENTTSSTTLKGNGYSKTTPSEELKKLDGSNNHIKTNKKCKIDIELLCPIDKES